MIDDEQFGIEDILKEFQLDTSDPKIGGLLVALKTYDHEKEELIKDLQRKARFDGLTGLERREFLQPLLEREVALSDRYGEDLSILLLDIDNFKKYNDNNGHENGNKLLKSLGSIIRKNIREGVDLGFRFGGDEFMIIINQAEGKIAQEIAYRIREKFLRLDCQNTDLSMGIEYYKEGCSIKNFMIEADKKVYMAKKSNEKVIE